jgi:hypothetical protein
MGTAAEPDEVKLARRLLALIKKHNLAELSAKDALDLVDGGGLKMNELNPALDLLVEREWLRELEPLPKKPQGGRDPSPRYLVNPSALE